MKTIKRATLESLLDADLDERERQIRILGDEAGFNLMVSALTIACYIQFPHNPSREELAYYVDHLKASFPPEREIKTVQTEAAIRAAFGDTDAIIGAPAGELLAIQVTVVVAVSKEHNLVGAAREKFITEVLDALD